MPTQPTVHNTNKASEHNLASVAKGADGPWKEDGVTLKPCWQKPVLGEYSGFLKNSPFFKPGFLLTILLTEEADDSQGYVTFSLTNGPEYHVSQVASYAYLGRSFFHFLNGWSYVYVNELADSK